MAGRPILLKEACANFLIVQVIYEHKENLHKHCTSHTTVKKDGANFALLWYHTPDTNLFIFMKSSLVEFVGIFSCPNLQILNVYIAG